MRLSLERFGLEISCTYVNKDGVDIVGAVVALEGSDVRPEVVR
jgi:hypothetical protein